MCSDSRKLRPPTQGTLASSPSVGPGSFTTASLGAWPGDWVLRKCCAGAGLFEPRGRAGVLAVGGCRVTGVAVDVIGVARQGLGGQVDLRLGRLREQLAQVRVDAS